MKANIYNTLGVANPPKNNKQQVEITKVKAWQPYRKYFLELRACVPVTMNTTF